MDRAEFVDPPGTTILSRATGAADMPFAEEIIARIDRLIEDRFETHPFSVNINSRNFDAVIGNYLTMSLAFPYLQAGAQLRVISHYISNDRDVTRGVEITAAVGAFLTWDETGGHSIVKRYGNSGLPKILDTENFHANLLRRDIQMLTGKEVPPAFTKETKGYLRRLQNGLSSIDPVARVANMVAFERHAGRMIDALWESASSLFRTDKSRLVYFSTHVGGSDPAEEYHIQMTSRMIAEVIQEEDFNRFLDDFGDAYALHFNWCKRITELSP